MDIKVNEQTETFYLAFENGWIKAAGHRITVGKYNFCAIFSKRGLNISEVETGCKVWEIPADSRLLWSTATKENTMIFLGNVGQSLERIVKKNKDFDEQLENLKRSYEERIGERPPIEKAYTDWIFEEESNVKH